MSIPLYILKRCLVAIPTLFLISFLGFFLMRYNIALGSWDVRLGPVHTVHILDKIIIKNPIDPLAGYRNNPQISPAALKQEEKRLGLDKPMLAQYGLWLSNIFQFHPKALLAGRWQDFFTPNLGKTFSGEEVSDLLMRRAGNTLLLNIIVVLLTWLIAIPPGVLSALRWRSLLDRMLTTLSSFGMSFPDFVLALLAAMLAVRTGWFPLGGVVSDAAEQLPWFQQIGDRAAHLILPVVVLTVGGLASLQRQMRGNLLDVLHEDYIRTARAKGLPERRVIWHHAMRNALNPLISIMGLTFADLLSGALLIETVLGYPGLGQLTYKAAMDTDSNLVMASLVLASVMLVLGNLLADILLKWTDPRIALED